MIEKNLLHPEKEKPTTLHLLTKVLNFMFFSEGLGKTYLSWEVRHRERAWCDRVKWNQRVKVEEGGQPGEDLSLLLLGPQQLWLLFLPLASSPTPIASSVHLSPHPALDTHTQACAPTLLVSPYNRSPRTSLLDKVTSVVPTSQHRLRGTPCFWTTCSPKWKIKSIGHHKNTHSGYFMFNISENNASTTYTWHL